MQCFAMVNKVSHTTGTTTFYDAVPCEKRASENPSLVDDEGNRRHFCTTHRSAALRGRVTKNGNTPQPADYADIRRIERKENRNIDWARAGWRKLT